MDTASSAAPSPASHTFDLPVEGPFSLRLLLRNVLRRPNEIVDVAIDGEYRRLLVHQGRRLLVRVVEPGRPDVSPHGSAGVPAAMETGGTPALHGGFAAAHGPDVGGGLQTLTVH